uniref:VPS26 endosomal protein sorting factor C n=1 Tax=Balaenoptera musculus TaxID=9771 RepID=A0A8C0CH17_BALMU
MWREGGLRDPAETGGEQAVQKGTPAMPQRFRTFRSPTGTCVGASLSPYTWSSPGSSPARHWRPPTSKWSSRLTSLCCFTLSTSSQRTSR